jgi:HD-GYP domain-containing protein (c-di-GMP phosphodiesterase class II)/DNA-binding CsgD family transcriptional regulator
VTPRVEIAGVLAALSVTSDLTRGHPPGEAMRACLLAVELAQRAGLSVGEQGDVFYAALMRFSGCSATSHEAAAALGGDDIAVRSRGDLIDATRPQEALGLLAGLGSGAGRVRVLARAPRVPSIVRESARADCEVGADLTRLVRLPETVRESVLCAFERFDGKGFPRGLGGPQLSTVARFVAVGFAAVMFDAVGGVDAATAAVRRWSGRALDPAIAAAFLGATAELLVRSDPVDLWAAVVEAEPEPRRWFRDEAHLDEVLAGFGDAADLKSPYFQGHSRGVARLARAACDTGPAPMAGLDPVLVHRAGLVHDLGRVAVPTGVWERPGRLRAEEWELVRLHPYYSGRILARAPALDPLGRMVARHHERLDGDGYPSGAHPGDLDAAARLLAAADVWHALGEPRPHRPALSPGQAAEVVAGLALDRDAVRAVMLAADAPAAVLPPLPVDLTERELQVLRLLAAGLTKRQIAARLFITHSTVHTHTVHIYGKCGVATRAGLAMFAMRHGLAATAP